MKAVMYVRMHVRNVKYFMKAPVLLNSISYCGTSACRAHDMAATHANTILVF